MANGIHKDLGKVTAYSYAKAAGYTGTEEQFQAIFNEFTENAPGLMDRMDTAVARAEAAVTDIDATIQDAVDDAVEEATASAVATANQAVTDAQAAQTAAEGAVTQANAAVTQANAAVTAAQAAQSAAEDAAESFVLDRTLTDSGAAAPADLVGDLKESLNELTPEVKAAIEQKTISNVAVASFKDGAYNVPLRSLVINIKPKRAGGGEPSPTNIRAISGHTNAYVLRTQKNIFYANYAELVNTKGNNYVGYRYDWLTGQFTVSAAANTTNDIIYAVVQKSNGTYDNDRLLASTSAHNTYTFSLNNGDILWIVDVSRTTESGIESAKTAFTQAKIQLEVGAEQTSYDSTAPSVLSMGGFGSAGTVYGATLNVTTGLLTVDTVNVVINSSSTILDYWGAATEHRIGVQFADTILSQYTDFWCSHYKVKTAYENNAIVKIHNSTSYVIQDEENVLSAQSFKDYADAQQQNGTPITLCYKLASPTIYQLSEKQLKTLLGANAFRTTAGTIATLSYVATNNTSENIKLTKALIAPVLDSMVADTTLVENDFRIVENTLYRITTSVASGATLTPSTNCTATTIAEILKSLLS